jgi:hypothetical protein
LRSILEAQCVREDSRKLLVSRVNPCTDDGASAGSGSVESTGGDRPAEFLREDFFKLSFFKLSFSMAPAAFIAKLQ